MEVTPQPHRLSKEVSDQQNENFLIHRPHGEIECLIIQAETPALGVPEYRQSGICTEYSLTPAIMSHLEASHLFSIKGQIAVVTGGGSGKS